uniref:Uncharacterized protein n=1 Tax=Cacopsylla melanoneura TaxID=428564 RepID=A0A8D9FHE5_9HEMI
MFVKYTRLVSSCLVSTEGILYFTHPYCSIQYRDTYAIHYTGCSQCFFLHGLPMSHFYSDTLFINCPLQQHNISFNPFTSLEVHFIADNVFQRVQYFNVFSCFPVNKPLYFIFIFFKTIISISGGK